MRLPWSKKGPLTNAQVRKILVEHVDEAQVSLDTAHRVMVDEGAPKVVIARNRRRWRNYERCRHLPVGTAVLRLHTLAYDARPINRYVTANPVENGTPLGLAAPGLTPSITRAKARRLAAGHRKADA